MRPLSELRTSGLLWLINRTVFHPRGLGLALHMDGDAVVGWSLMRANAHEPFGFTEADDNAGFRAAEDTLARQRQAGDTE